MITVLTAFGLSDSTVVTEKERNIKKIPDRRVGGEVGEREWRITG